MSTAVASKSTASSTTGSVTVTKPTGLAVGDIMLAFASAITGGADAGNAFTPPAGWTQLLALGGASNNSLLYVFAIKATATEVAAPDFTFTGGGTMDNAIGHIFRITGTNGFTSLAANVVSAGAVSTDYPTPSFAGLTTLAVNSLLLMGLASEITDGDIDFTAYSVVTSNPTWTEEYDTYNEPGGIANNAAVASATYAPKGATGNFSVTLDADGGSVAGALIAITENINVSVSPAVIGLQANVQAPSVTGGAVASPAVIGLQANVQAPSVAIAASKWQNDTKPSPGSVTNDAKT